MKKLALAVALGASLVSCSGSSEDPVNGTAAVINALELLLPLSELEVLARFNSTVTFAPVFVLVEHWDASVPARIPPFRDTEIASHGIITVDLDQDALDAIADEFPAGDTGDRLVRTAAQPLAPAPGAYHFVHLEVEFTLALTVQDPTLLIEYAFVFDEDGISTNNFDADPPQNYFNGTDQWYRLSYSNSQGWVLRVFTATTSGDTDTITEVASAARVIMTGNALILVVPAGEFTTTMPNYRVTSFVHTGDFGIPAPHGWTGNPEPRLVEGLQAYPAQN